IVCTRAGSRGPGGKAMIQLGGAGAAARQDRTLGDGRPRASIWIHTEHIAVPARRRALASTSPSLRVQSTEPPAASPPKTRRARGCMESPQAMPARMLSRAVALLFLCPAPLFALPAVADAPAPPPAPAAPADTTPAATKPAAATEPAAKPSETPA